MAELITLLCDIALGALAYRLALQNRAAIRETKEEVADLKTRVIRLEEVLSG